MQNISMMEACAGAQWRKMRVRSSQILVAINCFQMILHTKNQPDQSERACTMTKISTLRSHNATALNAQLHFSSSFNFKIMLLKSVTVIREGFI